MEKVTQEMSRIARKTQTETVSMKIITLVTLFFLPGTFIAVSGLFLLCLVSPLHCTAPTCATLPLLVNTMRTSTAIQ